MRKKSFQFILTAGSVMGLAAINYSILHTPFVFLVVLIMLAHELGHYFTAKHFDADPDSPYFIPIPFLAIGVTRIRKMEKLSYNSRKKIIAAGPFTGILVSLLFLFISYLYAVQYFIPLLMIFAAEIVFNYFGFDGKKYRHYSLQQKHSL